MRSVADQYKPLYVFFVIHGPDQSPPFEFRNVNLETSEVKYSVVEDTQPTWQEAWQKLDGEGTIGLFETAAMNAEADEIRRTPLEKAERLVMSKAGDALRLQRLAHVVGCIGDGELTIANTAFLTAIMNYIDRELPTRSR